MKVFLFILLLCPLLSLGRSLVEQASTEPVQPSSASVKLADDQEYSVSVNIIARESFLNYVSSLALDALRSQLGHVQIPTFTGKVSVGWLGNADTTVSSIVVQSLVIPDDQTSFSSNEDFLRLSTGGVYTTVEFDWGWKKWWWSGSGKGKLVLKDGNLLVDATVDAAQSFSSPQVTNPVVEIKFGTVEFTLESNSANWLYQLILSLFNGSITDGIESAVKSAVVSSIPEVLNLVLEALPGDDGNVLEVPPLAIQLGYNIKTTSQYVQVQGYSDISFNTTQTSNTLSECPHAVSPLPSQDQLLGSSAADMLSVYVDQSLINCLLSGAQAAGMLGISIEGDLLDLSSLSSLGALLGPGSGLGMNTALFDILIPGLAAAYPNMDVSMRLEAVAPPAVLLNTSGLVLSAQYRVQVFVLNETLSNPMVASLIGDLGLNALVSWTVTTITDVEVVHTLESSPFPILTLLWDFVVGFAVPALGSEFTVAQILTDIPIVSFLGEPRVDFFDGVVGLTSNVSLSILDITALI